MKPDYSKISYTAILCAKALTYNRKIPYVKEIYKKIKEKNLHKGHKLQIALASIGLRLFSGFGLIISFLEARYIGMNKILEKLNYPHVIELASGFTPRGLELGNKCRIVETDLDNVIKTKKEVIKNLPLNNYSLKSLNALNKEDLMKLGRLFKKNKPIAIIHSGLWTYLTKDEQSRLASNIRAFLEKYSKDGYWITPDIRPPSRFRNSLYRLYRRGITKKTGRAPTRFNNEEELNEFMKENKFKVKIVDVFDDIYPSLYIPHKFKLRKEDVKAQTEGMKMYIMRLKR